MRLMIGSVLLVGSLTVSSSVAATPIQWRVSDGGNGHWYELVSPATAMTWFQARAAAEAAGGYLVTITSEAEDLFVIAHFMEPHRTTSFRVWLGGSDDIGNGTWTWVTGEPFVYSHWQLPGQPSGGEYFLEYTWEPGIPGFGWNDIPASGWGTAPYHYIVEYDTRPDNLASLRLAKTMLSGCLRTTGKVTLAEPAPVAGTLVTLTSDNPHAVVPTSVLVKAGHLTKTFPITTSVVATREPAVITASDGHTNLSTTLTLRPIGPKTVTLLPNPVVGGSDSLGTVQLECPAAPGDIAVALRSTKPAIAQPGSGSVVVPAGEQTVPFTVMTNPVFVTTKPAIKATANAVTKSKALVVNPAP